MDEKKTSCFAQGMVMSNNFVCNNFLTLGFGCEEGEVLRF
jgi:hypothetical protein